MKIFFNYLLKEKLIEEKITFKMLPVDDEPCYINRAEINALYEIVDERMRRWFYFYEMVGCRAREPFKGFKSRGTGSSYGGAGAVDYPPPSPENGTRGNY